MNALNTVEKGEMRINLPAFRVGDTVRVHVKIKEGDKERIQIFEGIVIARKNGDLRSTFTVRKISFGQGVERIFPVHSPMIDKIDVVRSARVRRAKRARGWRARRRRRLRVGPNRRQAQSVSKARRLRARATPRSPTALAAPSARPSRRPSASRAI